MKTKDQDNQETARGAILAIVLIVMLIVTTLGGGMLALGGLSSVEVSKSVSSAEAFWAAEGGLELVKAICAKQRRPVADISAFSSDVLVFNGEKFTARLDGRDVTITFPEPAGWNNAARRVKRYNLTATAVSAGGFRHTVVQQAQIQTFASYMHATQYERTTDGSRIYFADGDILDGTVYVNDQLNIYGYPSFLKRAFTARPSVNYQSPVRRRGVDRRVFTRGLRRNARPLDFEDPNEHLDTLQNSANSGGLSLNGSYGISFNPNGSITYRRKLSHGWGAPTAKNLSTLNGAIYVSGDAYVSGKVKGSVTLAARHNIYITNDIIYASATVPDHSSSSFDDDVLTDALGLIAKDSVTVYRSNAIKRNDVNIHASILVTQGGFGCARRYETIGNPNINLLGGITQYRRGIVGQLTWPRSGFSKNYRYDTRLRTAPPACFPYSAYVFNSWRQTR